MKNRIRINGVLYESVEANSIIDDALRGDPNWEPESTNVGDGYALVSSNDNVEATIYGPSSEKDSLYFVVYMYDTPDEIVDTVVHEIDRNCRNVSLLNADSDLIEGTIGSRYITKSSVKGLAKALTGLVTQDDSVYDSPMEMGEPSSVRRYKSKTDFITVGYRGSNDSWIRVMTYGPFTVIDHDLTSDSSYNGDVAVIVGNKGYACSAFKEYYKEIVADLKKFVTQAKYPATSEELLKQFHRLYLNGKDMRRIKETGKGSADFKILDKYYRYV